MKGVVLAGGSGTRLAPVTRAVNKHLLPVYDTPLILFPLRTLKALGVTDVLIVTNPGDVEAFRRLLGTGEEFGVSLSFAAQERPAGIPDGIRVAEQWLGGSPFFLILGDNIFEDLGTVKATDESATVFLFPYSGADIGRFGVFNTSTGRIEEKPEVPASHLVATGLYFFPVDAPKLCRQLQPSRRGELEIADLLNLYADEGRLLHFTLAGDWMDCGTFSALWHASNSRKNRLSLS